MPLLFGTAGIPLSSREKSTVGGIHRLAELGLGCMELEFVHSVRMGRETAAAVAATARRLGIRLSVHAPYYINFNSEDPAKVAASRQRLLAAARVGHWCGAESVAFHAAFYGNQEEKSVCAARVQTELQQVLSVLEEEDNPITLRPETMGKPSQFGDLAEILTLCRRLPGLLPVIDFSHLHARTGKLNSAAEFRALLAAVEEALGPAALQNLHLHLSGIAYGANGEKRHLPLRETDMNYQDLLAVLKEKEASGLLICESPNLEEDALLLQATYQSL